MESVGLDLTPPVEVIIYHLLKTIKKNDISDTGENKVLNQISLGTIQKLNLLDDLGIII